MWHSQLQHTTRVFFLGYFSVVLFCLNISKRRDLDMVYSAKYWPFHFGSLKMTLLWTKCEWGLYLLYSDILFLLYNTFSSAMLEDFLFWYYWEEVNGGCLEKRGFSCNALTWIPSLDIAHISSLLYDWLFFVPQKWVWFRSCRQTRVCGYFLVTGSGAK